MRSRAWPEARSGSRCVFISVVRLLVNVAPAGLQLQYLFCSTFSLEAARFIAASQVQGSFPASTAGAKVTCVIVGFQGLSSGSDERFFHSAAAGCSAKACF